MIDVLLRQYDMSDTFDSNGYPMAWRVIKHTVRAYSRNRCVRCHHPYRASDMPEPGERGEWSRCDGDCVHGGPYRWWDDKHHEWIEGSLLTPQVFHLHAINLTPVESQWRILTVHHLDGDKANCRWWNLAPLCQRCHLSIQGKVVMDRVYDRQHTPWFMPYAAGFYAFKYLGEDLSRSDVELRMEELLLLELRQFSLFDGMMSEALSGEGGVKESSPGTRSTDVASEGSRKGPSSTSPPAESAR